MKKLALLLALIVSPFIFAQKSSVLGDFNTMGVFDQIQLTLVPSDTQKIEIEGTNADNVNVVNKNGNLKIKMNFVKSLQGEGIKVTLFYKSLTDILADEGASIKTTAPIKATKLDVTAKNGATIVAEIDTERVDVKAGSGSVVKLSGKAAVQDIVSNSGAEIKNKKLITNQTTVTVNAGGQADVYASELVDAKTRAGGSITIYGNPKNVTEKNVLGGTVKKVTNE